MNISPLLNRALIVKERESEGGRVLSILSLLPRVPNSRPNEGIISNAHADRSIRVGVGEREGGREEVGSAALWSIRRGGSREKDCGGFPLLPFPYE